jgi:hypothetical protein
MNVRIKGPWVGVINVRPLPGSALLDGAPGAFVNCAVAAVGIVDAAAQLAEHAETLELEIAGLDWLMPLDDATDVGEEAVLRDLASKVTEGGVVFDDTFHCYPEVDEPDSEEDLRDEVVSFVEGWLEGAVERFGGSLELGDFAFVAEMLLGPDSAGAERESRIGFAFCGPRERAGAFFARASETADDE